MGDGISRSERDEDGNLFRSQCSDTKYHFVGSTQITKYAKCAYFEESELFQLLSRRRRRWDFRCQSPRGRRTMNFATTFSPSSEKKINNCVLLKTLLQDDLWLIEEIKEAKMGSWSVGFSSVNQNYVGVEKNAPGQVYRKIKETRRKRALEPILTCSLILRFKFSFHLSHCINKTNLINKSLKFHTHVSFYIIH